MEDEDEIELEEKVGKEIVIQMKGKKRIQGTLTSFDEHMNLMVKEAEVYENEEPISERDLMVVKGGNVQSIID